MVAEVVVVVARERLREGSVSEEALLGESGAGISVSPTAAVVFDRRAWDLDELQIPIKLVIMTTAIKEFTRKSRGFVLEGEGDCYLNK